MKESEPQVAAAQVAEGVEVLHSSVKAGSVAQIVVAAIAIIGLIYLLKLVLVTILTALLLAYVLEPVVGGLSRVKVPRWAGALLVVLLALVMAGGLTYYFYNTAVEFTDELPHYSASLRETIGKIGQKAQQMEEHARSAVEPPNPGGQPIPVKVQEGQGLTRLMSKNGGTILDILLAIGFIPFLVYFMLVSKDHSHVALVRLFPKEHRLLAHRTVGRISAMIRSYIVANVVVALLNGAICTLVFWYVGIPYFYFVGFISAFLGLIPYLGVFLALLPPLTGGVESLHKGGLVIVLVTVVVLHLVTMNLIYPKVIGGRLQLNPLAVSLSLLFWAWVWGAMGLIFAIPILGAGKIICDHVEPLRALGDWLGGSVTS
jgi:predicted PurR-regulated permease PerM